jgi:hypothetical protein
MAAAMAKFTNCSRCGRENDPSFAFCLDCGLSLQAAPAAKAAPATCAACGARLEGGFRFCGQCGKPVAVPEGAPAPTGAPAARAALRLAAVRADGSPGAVHALDGEVLCGRTEGAIRLADDATVSPRHVRFTVLGHALRVEDLGSVNGTFVRIQGPHPLRIGEELRVGRQLLRLEPLPRPASPDVHGVRAWGAPDAGARFRLAQLLEGGGLGEIFPLRPGENAVGRDAGEVAFPSDRYVSARHARIDVSGDEVTVTDLGSSNGTFVKLAGAAELGAGDHLLVGGQLFRVESATAT